MGSLKDRNFEMFHCSCLCNLLHACRVFYELAENYFSKYVYWISLIFLEIDSSRTNYSWKNARKGWISCSLSLQQCAFVCWVLCTPHPWCRGWLNRRESPDVWLHCLECGISLFVPCLPLAGSWVPDTLQPLAELTGTGQSYLPEEGTQQGLELQLSLHKMAVLKGTKLDKLSLISRLLVPFQQWFLEWQHPHVGVGLRWSQGKGLLIVSSGIAE